MIALVCSKEVFKTKARRAFFLYLSSIGRLDLNDGSWCFILKDLGDEKTGTLTHAFHIVRSICVYDILHSYVNRSVLVLIANSKLRSSRSKSTRGLWDVVQGSIKHDQELVETACLELIHEREGHDLEILLELRLRDLIIGVVGLRHHVGDQAISFSGRSVAIGGGVIWVGLEGLGSASVEILNIISVSDDVAIVVIKWSLVVIVGIGENYG